MWTSECSESRTGLWPSIFQIPQEGPGRMFLYQIVLNTSKKWQGPYSYLHVLLAMPCLHPPSPRRPWSPAGAQPLISRVMTSVHGVMPTFNRLMPLMHRNFNQLSEHAKKRKSRFDSFNSPVEQCPKSLNSPIDPIVQATRLCGREQYIFIVIDGSGHCIRSHFGLRAVSGLRLLS